MKNTNLQFGSTMTVRTFKKHIDAVDEALQVIRNPHTEKLFFRCGDVSGKVAAAFDIESDAALAQVTDTDSGEVFWMLFNSTASANVVGTL